MFSLSDAPIRSAATRLGRARQELLEAQNAYDVMISHWFNTGTVSIDDIVEASQPTAQSNMESRVVARLLALRDSLTTPGAEFLIGGLPAANERANAIEDLAEMFGPHFTMGELVACNKIQLRSGNNFALMFETTW